MGGLDWDNGVGRQPHAPGFCAHATHDKSLGNAQLHTFWKLWVFFLISENEDIYGSHLYMNIKSITKLTCDHHVVWDIPQGYVRVHLKGTESEFAWRNQKCISFQVKFVSKSFTIIESTCGLDCRAKDDPYVNYFPSDMTFFDYVTDSVTLFRLITFYPTTHDIFSCISKSSLLANVSR